MKILYVYGMAETKDIVYNLRKLGYVVEEYPRKQQNSLLNDMEMDGLMTYIKKNDITHLMSIHLIYNAALVAYRSHIKYISLIWDAPYIKLYTPFGRMDNCWFSVFDRWDCERFIRDGIPHVLYQPLAVNHYEILKLDIKRKLQGRYFHEISFVGSLYDNNYFDRDLKKLPGTLQEYFIDIFEKAAFCWDGVNYVYGKMDQAILDHVRQALPDFQMDHGLDVDDIRFFETAYLIRKIANIERICVLNLLGETFPVTFYTNTGTDTSMLTNVEVMPPVLPGKDVFTVYAGSKINLNLSLKGMEGGTPQRVMDIMGAGGFVLSTYCQETAELFEEDKEIVMFRTPEELIDKVTYYLSHDKERERIAAAGCAKVLKDHTYEKKLRELIGWVETGKQG